MPWRQIQFRGFPPREYTSTAPNLILSVLGQIANPRECLVATPVHNLQVSDLESRYREVWDLEFNVNWVLLVLVSVRRFDCWQLEFGVHHVLSSIMVFVYLWPGNDLIDHLNAPFSGT